VKKKIVTNKEERTTEVFRALPHFRNQEPQQQHEISDAETSENNLEHSATSISSSNRPILPPSTLSPVLSSSKNPSIFDEEENAKTLLEKETKKLKTFENFVKDKEKQRILDQQQDDTIKEAENKEEEETDLQSEEDTKDSKKKYYKIRNKFSKKNIRRSTASTTKAATAKAISTKKISHANRTNFNSAGQRRRARRC